MSDLKLRVLVVMQERNPAWYHKIRQSLPLVEQESLQSMCALGVCESEGFEMAFLVVGCIEVMMRTQLTIAEVRGL